MANGVSMIAQWSMEQRQLIVEMMVRVDKMFDEMRASFRSVKFKNEGVVSGLASEDFNSNVVDDKKEEEKENDGLMLGIKQNEYGSIIGWIPSYDDQVVDSMSELDYQKLDELENCNQISFCKRDLRDQDQIKAVMLSPSIHSLDAFEHNPFEVNEREKADLKNSFNLMAVTIVSINARQIFDHHGNPMVEVDVKMLDGKKVRVADSGVASTGIYEILERRDEGFDYLALGSPKLEPKVSKNTVLINYGDTRPFHPFQHCKQENAGMVAVNRNVFQFIMVPFIAEYKFDFEEVVSNDRLAWPFVLKAVGACENHEKAYSMLFLSKNKLITIRDPYGFRLLVMERMKHGVVRSKILVVVRCLALGTKQMVVPNAIFQPLSFVETLGCTTVNCMDNEGTLTADVMSISEIFVVSYEQNSVVVVESSVRRTTYAPESLIFDSIEKFELPGFDSNALGLTCLKKVESGSKRVKELCLGAKNIVVNSNEKAQSLKKAIEDRITKRGICGIGLMTTAHATTTAQKNVDDFSLHCQQYSEIGAHITNCHTVLKTDSNEPIELAIQENAKTLAMYALVVLATGLLHENIKKFFLLDYALVLLDIETLGGLMVVAAKFDVDNGANQDIVWLQQDLGLYLCNFFNTRQVLKVLKNNFDKARQSVPCVLLFDELDSITTADDATSFASRVHVLQSSLIHIICGKVGDMNRVPKVQEIVSANCGKSTCKGIKAIIQGGIPRSDVMKLLLLKVILLSIVENQPTKKSGAIIKIDSSIIEGNDYFCRLGKGDDNVNMIIDARVYIIDNIFAGNFLGKDSDIMIDYKMAVNHSASSHGMVDDCLSQGASNWDHVRKEICYVCCEVNINSLLYKHEL